MEFLSPTFQQAELECKAAPSGQLTYEADAATVSSRILSIDESGEDCRQKLARVRMKVEVYQEVIAEVNKAKEKKK